MTLLRNDKGITKTVTVVHSIEENKSLKEKIEDILELKFCTTCHI